MQNFPARCFSPCRGAALELRVAFLGLLLGAAVVGVGVPVVLVGGGEGDGPLVPAVERAALVGHLASELVVLQQRLPVLPFHQQPRLGLRQGDPVVEVPKQDHPAACHATAVQTIRN